MLIVSKFNDYYDIGLSYGVDKSIVYNRKTEYIDKNPLLDNTLGEFRSKISDQWGQYMASGGSYCVRVYDKDRKATVFRCRVIFFCGKLYPFVEFTDERGKIHFHHSVDEFLSKDYDDSFIGSIGTGRVKSHFNPPPEVEQEYARYFEEELKVPCAVMPAMVDHTRYVGIMTNPCLKDLGFITVKDPWTAFQEISMYLSNQLATVDNPPQITSDEVLRDAKGFDDKSFKKLPTKKRRK